MTQPATRSLAIALVGATGNIGSRILDEALNRGHSVTGIVRNVQRLPSRARLRATAAEPASAEALAAALAGHDLAIFSVKWADFDVRQALSAVRASGVPRAIFVVGAGSLLMADGRTWYQHNLERGSAPPTSASAVAAYEEIRREAGLDWTAVSPPATIQPGTRTGRFRTGLDRLLTDENGESRISMEDFAVAVVDEAEQGRHVRGRFTAAY